MHVMATLEQKEQLLKVLEHGLFAYFYSKMHLFSANNVIIVKKQVSWVQ